MRNGSADDLGSLWFGLLLSVSAQHSELERDPKERTRALDVFDHRLLGSVRITSNDGGDDAVV